MLFNTEIKQRYIDASDRAAFTGFTDTLYEFLEKGIKSGRKTVVFVCIGTDRSTGDSLGPLIGYKINDIKFKNIHVFGNLDEPVHAKNLPEVMQHINQMFVDPFIVAIDACLGRMDHVGFVTVGEGPIKPGSGVNKDLAPVGDMHITGIVNFGGFMDFIILQNTRLGIVMKMADLIASGIKYVLWKANNNPEMTSVICRLEA